MSIFEILMLACFASAWPVSIYKGLTSKSIEGKSIRFSYIILFGYILGMLHKTFYAWDSVFYMYVFNALLVITDIVIYYRNKRRLLFK